MILNISNDFGKSLTYMCRLNNPWVDDPKSKSVRNITVSYFEYFAATQRHACGSAGFRNAAMVAQKISWGHINAIEADGCHNVYDSL